MEMPLTLKEPEPDDPLELTGVVFPAESEGSVREMALCFVEEFLRAGWPEERIRSLFRNPFYRGPHRIWRQKGEAYLDGIIREVRTTWQGASDEHRL